MADRYSDIAGEPAEYLEWDSDFFGKRIARVRGQRLSDGAVAEILHWCSAQRIDCLYFLASAADPSTVELAERSGFALVDIRVTFERGLQELAEEGDGIRRARPDDVAQLQRITGRSFADSRFYYDRHFDRARCDALYAAWIERSCQGYADCVLVAEAGGEAVGYATCKLGESQTGSIGLIAVDAKAQGCGAGRRLLISALHYFREHGMTRGAVVTQGRNLKSQRLYQRNGFLIQSAGLWYHRWFT